MSQKWWGCLALLVVAGCAQGPNVRSELPLRRVVVYRNGVGYFERAGQVESEAVRFEMRQRMVGDFLASLAVIEKGGSSVRSASFPLEIDDSTAPDEQEMRAPDTGECPGKLAPHEDCPPPKRRSKPDPNAMREVVLHLDGNEHDLLIGYLSETPVWRPSYRVVVETDGSAALQAWGIVQNLSGEDWNDVQLSLVAGAPLAFQSTLGTPVIPRRPVVTDDGEVIEAMPEGMTSLDRSNATDDVDSYGPERGYGGATPAAAPMAPMANMEMEKATSDNADEAYELKKSAGPSHKPKAQSRSGRVEVNAEEGMGLSGIGSLEPRNMSDLAAVALEGATTRYDMPFKVTVPNHSATMVMLTSQRVPGETVLLFGPEPGVSQSNTHPYRVARITNSSPGLLERGPIAVFERGSFLGQGVLDALPPRATATVPFALERSVLVESEQRMTQQGARLFRIESGNLWIERDWVQRTLYKVDSGSDKPAKLLVKHMRAPGTRLFKPPAGTEDNAGTGSALIPVSLKPHSKTELTVEERRAIEDVTNWFSADADSAVKEYLSDSRGDRELVQALSSAWKVRGEVTKSSEEVMHLEHEQSELERLSEQTRGNLRAIEKNTQAQDLRLKLTKRLGDASLRLDAITKRLIELRMAADELGIRFTEAVRELTLSAPLPPK